MTTKRRKWLAATKQEIWAYASVVTLLLGCLVDPVYLSAGLLILATLFWAIYLIRSFLILRTSSELAPALKWFVVIWNIVWTAFHTGFVVAKIWLLINQLQVQDILKSYFDSAT